MKTKPMVTGFPSFPLLPAFPCNQTECQQCVTQST